MQPHVCENGIFRCVFYVKVNFRSAWTGKEVPNLGTVVNPPEKGQGSGVTGPNHHGEVSFLPLDGNNGSREIYTLHRT